MNLFFSTQMFLQCHQRFNKKKTNYTILFICAPAEIISLYDIMFNINTEPRVTGLS